MRNYSPALTIKPHKSLRLKIDSGNRKWFQRTPAMAEGITDHIWSLKELLTFSLLSAGRHKNPFNFSIDIVFFRTFDI
ncbi:hypothetical protein ASJ81_21050 [Methanosarcina spelaei]|uniref:Uncharacterized protein n=1 Tax=Methanosarcina spelaei TaxID=1036679 RepID=A0A2A2HRT3_9EURY|nr:hypothetical protein ASJ81_21050 [Methanosarcina spelaei]